MSEPIAPNGMYSLPLAAAADLIAECQAFQSWIGAADEDLGTDAAKAAAAARIHFISHDDDPAADAETLLGQRPLAIVGFAGAAEATKETEPPEFEHSQAITVAFEEAAYGDAEATTGQKNDRDAVLHFANALGAVMEDVEELTGRDGRLLIVSHRLVEGPGRPTRTDRDAGELDVVGAVMQWEWQQR